MARRASERLQDMFEAVRQLENIIRRYGKDNLANDRVALAAVERFIEILSQASRHIPPDLKETELLIPWRDIANIGNYLHHAYPSVDFGIL